jgi:thiamine biosynthesis lipoprotein
VNAELGAAVAAPQEYTQVHMGVRVRVVLYADDEHAGRAAAAAAFARIAALDQVMSAFRVDSELRRLERRPGEWVPVSAELFAVVTRAVDIARATDGAFDPSVGPLVALWRDARQQGALPGESTFRAARDLVGWRRIGLEAARRAVRLERAGMQVDLGGIAKGYILQDALRTLSAHGVARALLEAGGDIVVGDPPPMRAGWRIEVPGADRGFAAQAASLVNAAVATSGATVQFVEIDGVRYSHVIDPRTGLGVTNHVVAHTIGPDGATADALATALSVLGSAGLELVRARFPDVRAIVYADNPQMAAPGDNR